MTGDVGIISFYGPGVLGICWDDVISSMCCSISYRGIGTSGNGFGLDSRLRVYCNYDLEGCSDTITCCPGGRCDRIGDSLYGIGGID